MSGSESVVDMFVKIGLHVRQGMVNIPSDPNLIKVIWDLFGRFLRVAALKSEVVRMVTAFDSNGIVPAYEENFLELVYKYASFTYDNRTVTRIQVFEKFYALVCDIDGFVRCFRDVFKVYSGTITGLLSVLNMYYDLRHCSAGIASDFKEIFAFDGVAGMVLDVLSDLEYFIRVTHRGKTHIFSRYILYHVPIRNQMSRTLEVYPVSLLDDAFTAAWMKAADLGHNRD